MLPLSVCIHVAFTYESMNKNKGTFLKKLNDTSTVPELAEQSVQSCTKSIKITGVNPDRLTNFKSFQWNQGNRNCWFSQHVSTFRPSSWFFRLMAKSVSPPSVVYFFPRKGWQNEEAVQKGPNNCNQSNKLPIQQVNNWQHTLQILNQPIPSVKHRECHVFRAEKLVKSQVSRLSKYVQNKMLQCVTYVCMHVCMNELTNGSNDAIHFVLKTPSNICICMCMNVSANAGIYIYACM